ncbi:16S rRNA (guanine(527)-N(7))-methyltransferase RsmG [Alicyclobacillaceae bacterium I2511]|jgi:16S rRNA (guanine527-N7)-methyltransferase|nr:16S rRNA (guanine(527)-N(7))-methyltransferase RsmG [Alicyclobacillaceae bacterium I2511]
MSDRDALRSYFPDLCETTWVNLGFYYKLLLEWNQHVNLTAIVDLSDVYIKHFYDSYLVRQLPEWKQLVVSGAQIVDVGSGAGFPGLPLAMAYSDVFFSLCDARTKRLKFLEVVVAASKLSNVRMVHARAEDLGQSTEFRGLADGVVARAVAPLPILVELCLPLLRVGGYLFAYKGPGVADELEESVAALSILGGRVCRVESFQLPLQKGMRSLVVIEKMSVTESRFPRQAGILQKRPLNKFST